MSTEITAENKAEITARLIRVVNTLYKNVENEFNRCLESEPDNQDLLKCLKKKYTYLTRFKVSKRTKITKCKANISELFLMSEIKDEFSNDEIKIIYRYIISKIRGLYKHAQALKTGFCNGQIINCISEENTMSVCITKNTLEANEQWLSRLYKELDNRYPLYKLNNKIMIISSKPNYLGGNATHCKTMNDALSYFIKPNSFKIIFACSNKIRIQDIYELATSLLNLKKELVKNLRILHDEAHNTKEGIPPFRYLIENILILPNVLSYQPITASLGDIVDKTNPIWTKDNLESHAINFTDFDNTKSNDQKYSSISDYKKFTFECLRTKENWKNFEIKDVSMENFIKVEDKYKGKKIRDLSDVEEEDINNRRELEFCKFMENDKEIEALNNGLNILNLNSILGNSFYTKDKFNLHIISTPRRKILSHELCTEASKKDYNPIVLGIYGNQGCKYHLFVDGIEEKCVDTIMGDGEFNCKLYNLIQHLKRNGCNTNRPFIIIGNYTPTGESLSYVNYKYGTVRSVSRLISTNAEEDYQTACRGNYMNTKFLENDREWIADEKFLIGDEEFIKNALSYEEENDKRIDTLTESNNDTDSNNIILPSPNNISVNIVRGTPAIPIKIDVDIDDKNYEKLIEIANKPRRTSDEKKDFLKLLKESVEDPVSDFKLNDKTGKFDLDNITLVDFRCYKRESKIIKGYWKFKNYENNFKSETSFINNTSNHRAKQCEVLVCKDKYIIQNKKGDVIEKNSKTTWWIGYKY